MPRLRRHIADIGQLSTVLESVEADARALGLPRATVLRLQLFTEELMMNSVMHGSSACIGWALWQGPGGLGLRYADNGAAWLPPAAGRPVPEPDDDRIGGHGLRLLDAMSSRLVRRRFGGWNVVHLEISSGNSSCLRAAS